MRGARRLAVGLGVIGLVLLASLQAADPQTEIFPFLPTRTIFGQINVQQLGATGNTQSVTTGAMTAGSTVLTSASAKFAAADVGKKITVGGAGAAGALLDTTVTNFTSATTITLAVPALTTVTGATVWWGTDDAAAINAAIVQANAVGGAGVGNLATGYGSVVVLPPGVYWTTVPILMKPHVILRGQGKESSVIYANHDGDGVHSLFPINSSTAAYIRVEDLGIVSTRTTNTGAAYADTGGTYLDFNHVQFQSFKYGLILDQSELVTVRNCDFEMLTSNHVSAVWLVNGAEHTVGAQTGFTNGITIRDSQFNATTPALGIIDDGGSNHEISGNNFNAGAQAAYFAGVRGLMVLNNASQNHTVNPFVFDRVTQQGAVVKRPVTGVIIKGNTPSDGTNYHFVLNAVEGGLVQGNWTCCYLNAMVNLSGGLATGVEIVGNTKDIDDTNRTAGPFVQDGGSLNINQLNTIRQLMMTYATSGAIGAGAQTITPATMGLTATSPSLSESFAVGDTLFVRNPDNTNGEYVVVTAVGGATFTATFALSKVAAFLIYGQARQPTLSGVTGSIGGGALLAGACASGTATVTGATTAMVAEAEPNTYPGDGVIWDAQVTSTGTVTVKVCAIVGLTPTASTYNVRVLR